MIRLTRMTLEVEQMKRMWTHPEGRWLRLQAKALSLGALERRWGLLEELLHKGRLDEEVLVSPG